MFDDLKMFARYVLGLKRFLQQPLSPEQCRRLVEHQLRTRDEAFLRLLERGVFANTRSPYRKLLAHAGIEFGDIEKSIREDGVEATLEKLYSEGVYVTYDEFKGREPIQRRGCTLSVGPKDFDNPLLAKHYETRTGGSRSVGTRVIVDFDLLTHEAAYYDLFLTAFALAGRPTGAWLPVPPLVNGMKHMLRYAKVEIPIDKWFAQNRLIWRPPTLKYAVFTQYAIYGSRFWGRPLPVPEYTPLDQAGRVAEWLANKKSEGAAPVLDTTPSSGVRVCLAAQGQHLDISGVFFRFNSEPYTPSKAQVVAETGSQASSDYSMAEIGNLGMACAAPTALDDVHLVTDKIAVIQRDKPMGTSGVSVGALLYTTLLPSCPKLMLNVESDDYGVLSTRDCGCPFGEIGFRQHLHTIRSYDKLTSEGMTFLGSELISLVEEVLPARVGGGPTDYQLVEEEEGGFPKISIVVSPRVAEVSEEQIVTIVLSVLRSYPGAKMMMADLWHTGNTLRVVRREPYATCMGKVLPLHILNKR